MQWFVWYLYGIYFKNLFKTSLFYNKLQKVGTFKKNEDLWPEQYIFGYFKKVQFMLSTYFKIKYPWWYPGIDYLQRYH